MQFGSSPPSYPTSIPIEPTIPREWLENPRLEPKREKRGWLDARYEKFQKVGSGKKVGDGKGIRVGIRIAREAKLVGGNLSRGAVRIHLNPPLPSRDSSFESLAEKDLVSAVGEKRLKGESARRSAEIGSFYYRSMPALLSRHGLNKVNRLKAAMHRCEQYPWEVEIHQPFFLSIRAGRRLRNVRETRSLEKEKTKKREEQSEIAMLTR